MQNGWNLLLIAALAVGAACSGGRHSAAAFRLPPDGDPARGKAAFIGLGCYECHEVAGDSLPHPTVQPPVPVVLGGMVEDKFSDAYVATSILYPAQFIGPYPKDRVTSAGVSRMPSYEDRMTVREMVDLVAYVQSRYILRPAPPASNFR